jgi:hypothetical protein
MGIETYVGYAHGFLGRCLNHDDVILQNFGHGFQSSNFSRRQILMCT